MGLVLMQPRSIETRCMHLFFVLRFSLPCHASGMVLCKRQRVQNCLQIDTSQQTEIINVLGIPINPCRILRERVLTTPTFYCHNTCKTLQIMCKKRAKLTPLIADKFISYTQNFFVGFVTNAKTFRAYREGRLLRQEAFKFFMCYGSLHQ